jgi:hypothetical protein
MKVDITGTCGHTSERNLTDASGGEPGPRSLKKSVAYWSTKDCTDCYVSGKKAATAAALETFGTLPDLVGSERQVAWAVRIRETALTKVSETVRDGDYWARATLLATVTDATFWIDTRDESVDVLLGDKVGYDHAVKYDLDAGKVSLSARGKRKEISYIQKRGYYKGTPRTIMVGGNKFYDRAVS